LPRPQTECAITIACAARSTSEIDQVGCDRVLIPLKADARDLGNVQQAVVDLVRLLQDGVGPILPLQPVRGFSHADAPQLPDIDGWNPKK
jgi:hypothetical protein